MVPNKKSTSPVSFLNAFLYSIQAVKENINLQHWNWYHTFLCVGMKRRKDIYSCFVIVYYWSCYNTYIVYMVCCWIERRLYITEHPFLRWSNVFLGDVPTSRWSVKREVKKLLPWFHCYWQVVFLVYSRMSDCSTVFVN